MTLAHHCLLLSVRRVVEAPVAEVVMGERVATKWSSYTLEAVGKEERDLGTAGVGRVE